MNKLMLIGMFVVMNLGTLGCSVKTSSPYAYNCQGIDVDMRCKNSQRGNASIQDYLVK